ncbi:MAG: dipicolinate synthase subunit DpsA [Velocimicrobium sp.]
MYEIVLFGGDIRQIYMAQYFRALDYSVITYGLSHPLIQDICKQASSFQEAISLGSILIGPIPLSNDQTNIPSLTSCSDLNLDTLLDTIRKDQVLFAGMISTSVVEYCDKNQIICYDFMKEDSVAIANGIATAEGAIMEAIGKSTGNLHKSSTLVLGFGRCAKILAHKLDGLDAYVTVCARNDSDLAYAEAFGYETCTLCDLPAKINSYSYIFNSIPYMVLSKELLYQVSKDTTIIDIASSPGGLDYSTARALNLNASLSLGIPGKVAPKASAKLLANYCLKKLSCRKKVSP